MGEEKPSPLGSPSVELVASGLGLDVFVVEKDKIGYDGVFTSESIESTHKFVSFGVDLSQSNLPNDPLNKANRFRAICGTLRLLNRLITDCEIEPVSSTKQLVTLHLEADWDGHGHFDVNAETSPEFRHWVENNFLSEAQQGITETLAQVHSEITSKRRPHTLYSDRTEDGRLSITVPGENCQFYALNTYSDTTCGWEFNCHNMDFPIQQILTLVGIARVCDMIRAETACS